MRRPLLCPRGNAPRFVAICGGFNIEVLCRAMDARIVTDDGSSLVCHSVCLSVCGCNMSECALVPRWFSDMDAPLVTKVDPFLEKLKTHVQDVIKEQDMDLLTLRKVRLVSATTCLVLHSPSSLWICSPYTRYSLFAPHGDIDVMYFDM